MVSLPLPPFDRIRLTARNRRNRSVRAYKSRHVFLKHRQRPAPGLCAVSSYDFGIHRENKNGPRYEFSSRLDDLRLVLSFFGHGDERCVTVR